MARTRIMSAIIAASSKHKKINTRAKVEFKETLDFLTTSSFKTHLNLSKIY